MAPLTSAPVSGAPTIFIVDDDADTRELYRVVLESVGYRVCDAPRISAARAVLDDCVPDAVLTDWLLPDGDGLAVCDVLRARRATRRVPVLAISGLDGDSRHEEARQRGVVSWLEKPATPERILEAVRNAVFLNAERRVRSAAERARRYAWRIARCARLRAGGENARAEASALLRRVAARSTQPLTLLIADDAARYVAVSAESRALTGYDPGELERLSVWDLTPPPASADSEQLWRQFIAAGKQEGRFTLLRRDGATVGAHYCAMANVAPGLHVSALAESFDMPVTL